MFPGNGLALDGVEHAKYRLIVASAFSKILLPNSFQLIKRRATEVWNQAAEKLNKQGRNSVSLETFIRRYYLDKIITLSCGIRMNSNQADCVRNLFLNAMNGIVTNAFGPLAKLVFEAKAEPDHFPIWRRS